MIAVPTSTGKSACATKTSSPVKLSHYRSPPSVRFPVESRSRKRKGVSRNDDPSGGRREETPHDSIPRWQASTARGDRTSLARGGRTGAGNAAASCGGTLVGGTGPAGERGPAAGRESVPLGLHSAEMLDHAVGQPGAGARAAAARARRDRADRTL